MSKEDQTNLKMSYTRKNYISMATFSTTLAVGLTLTWILYVNFVKVDNDWITDRIKRGTDTLISAINPVVPIPNPYLEQINSKFIEIRANISNEQEITQELLDSHLWETPPAGLETTTIEYLPRIGFNEALELETRFGGRVSDGFEIVQNNHGVISPAPVRDEYFPVLIEASNQEWGTVLGDDRTLTNPLIKIVQEQARDTGEIVSHTFFPLADQGDQVMLSHYYQAIYTTGYVPDTIDERREKLSGFVSIVSYYPLLKEFLAFYPETYQGMEVIYFPLSGSYQLMEKPVEVERGIKAGHILETTYFFQALDGEPWLAISRANPELITLMQTTTRWWVLSVGVFFSCWISGMICWYRKKSDRLSTQVNHSKQYLSEQSEKLKDAGKDLQAAEERYRILSENTSEVIYSYDLDGVCTYISPSVTKQSGFQANEYIGKPLQEHLAETSVESLTTRLDSLKEKVLENIDKTEKSYASDYEMKCLDGSVKAMKSTITLIFDDNGAPNGILGVVKP